MPINTEMFRRIDEIITANPEQHDQHSFEAGCGTTRCVAGWAIHLWGQDNELTGHLDYLYGKYMKLHPEAMVDAGMTGAEASAAHILGLTVDQMDDLFYDMSDMSAHSKVRDYAQGIPAV